MQNENDTVVFLGPSLPVAEAKRILPARYEPPARFASVYQLIGSDVRTILLIDGVFHSQPAIWQRELDTAIGAGVTVYGASSMGALRAAELAQYGMIGHGEVFDWYYQNKIDGDDEVALLHSDEESGYRAMSEPMVNIRFTLQQACAAGIVAESEHDAVVAVAKRVYYPQRSFERLVADLEVDGTLAHLSGPLAAFFATHRVDIKQRDAVSLLRHVSELREKGATREVATPDGKEVTPFVLRVQHGAAQIYDRWYALGQGHRRLEHEGRAWTLNELSELVASNSDVRVPNLGGTGSLDLSAGACKQLAFDRALRAVVREYAALRQLAVPDAYLSTVRERMSAAIAETSRDTASWLQACRMTLPELELRLADEALVAWFAAQLPVGVETFDTLPPPLAPDGELADAGLYLRIFSSDPERRACQQVGVAALLEMESRTMQSFESAPHAWEWARSRLAKKVVKN